MSISPPSTGRNIVKLIDVVELDAAVYIVLESRSLHPMSRAMGAVAVFEIDLSGYQIALCSAALEPIDHVQSRHVICSNGQNHTILLPYRFPQPDGDQLAQTFGCLLCRAIANGDVQHLCVVGRQW